MEVALGLNLARTHGRTVASLTVATASRFEGFEFRV